MPTTRRLHFQLHHDGDSTSIFAAHITCVLSLSGQSAETTLPAQVRHPVRLCAGSCHPLTTVIGVQAPPALAACGSHPFISVARLAAPLPCRRLRIGQLMQLGAATLGVRAAHRPCVAAASTCGLCVSSALCCCHKHVARRGGRRLPWLPAAGVVRQRRTPDREMRAQDTERVVNAACDIQWH